MSIAALLTGADVASEWWFRLRHPGERYGEWMPTVSGEVFWPLDPQPEEVHIRDIAWALAHIPRFGGHIGGYSVAQHSVLAAEQAGYMAYPLMAASGFCFYTGLRTLLHDAAEAYLGDTIRPLKRLPAWAPYRRYERRLQRVIESAFGLHPIPGSATCEVVKTADERMLSTEVRDLMPFYFARHRTRWGKLAEPYPFPEPLQPWSSQVAYTEFLNLFREYAKKQPDIVPHRHLLALRPHSAGSTEGGVTHDHVG